MKDINISCNANEIIGDMKRTKIQLMKTGNLHRIQKQNQKSDQRKENSILQKSFVLKKQQGNLESNSLHS